MADCDTLQMVYSVAIIKLSQGHDMSQTSTSRRIPRVPLANFVFCNGIRERPGLVFHGGHEFGYALFSYGAGLVARKRMPVGQRREPTRVRLYFVRVHQRALASAREQAVLDEKEKCAIEEYRWTPPDSLVSLLGRPRFDNASK
jgi:hypothetical protein